MIRLITTLEPARIPWLAQFISHYIELGVESFHISLQFEENVAASLRKREIDKAYKILRSFDIFEIHELVCMFDAMQIRKHHDSLQRVFLGTDCWFVWADIDEFQVYRQTLHEHKADLEASNRYVFGGSFVDRVSRSGRLTPFNPNLSIWGQYPIGASITRDVLKGWIGKVTLSYNSVQISSGNHRPVGEDAEMQLLKRGCQVHHFKWDSSVKDRLRVRLSEPWKKRCPWWVQTDRLFDYLARNDSIIPYRTLDWVDFMDDVKERPQRSVFKNERYLSKDVHSLFAKEIIRV